LVFTDSVSVAFVEPESPGNIGFLARTMKNFGLSSLILVGGCPLGEDSWTFAMHAKDVLERAERTTWEGLLSKGFDFCVGTTSKQGHDANLPRVAIGPREMGEALKGVDGRVCIVLGREGNGLTMEELRACDLIVSIPTSEEYPAMNVSHAAAVLLYEIFGSSGIRPNHRMRRANAREKEVLLNFVDRMIDSSHMPEHRKRNSRLVFRRLLNRAFVSGRECHTLIGLMKALSSRED